MFHECEQTIGQGALPRHHGDYEFSLWTYPRRGDLTQDLDAHVQPTIKLQDNVDSHFSMPFHQNGLSGQKPIFWMTPWGMTPFDVSPRTLPILGWVSTTVKAPICSTSTLSSSHALGGARACRRKPHDVAIEPRVGTFAARGDHGQLHQ